MAAQTYRVEAYNLSHASENRIHDDATAQRFGFTGGLVPGVEVFAYCCHPAVERWGTAFLERGAIACGFQKPVYDGRVAVVTATADGDALALRVESEGVACASGRASMPDDAASAPTLWPAAPPPAERPKASEETLAPGRILGTRALALTDDVLADYLRDVRETDPRYAAEGIAHPGLLLRMCNRLLTENVVLGPWIHVASDLRFLGLARRGEALTARARIAANIERKGHRIVTLDAVVLADGRPVAHVSHDAIWRPRQVAEGGG